MAILNYVGSLRYDTKGKKRKTKSLRQARKTKTSASTTQAVQSVYKKYEQQEKAKQDFFDRLRNAVGDTTRKADDRYKREISSDYSIGVAYNKGAYQVIPRSEIKHMGRK